MSQRVQMPNGQVAEFPDGMKPEQITSAIKANLMPPSYFAAPHAGLNPEQVSKLAPGARAMVERSETALKARDDPGAPLLPASAGPVMHPAEVIATGATLPLTAGAGAIGGKLLSQAPKVGAALGRMAAGTGIGAGREMAQTGGVGWGTVIDAALEGGTEALSAGLGKALKGAGAASRGVKWATGALEPALDYVRDRLKTTRMVIPSIDPVKKITWDEAISALKKMTGQDYKVARAEIANWMNAVDKQELRPRAGQVFKDMTSKMRFPASSFSELAEQTRGAVGANIPRATADVAATERVTDADIPAGLVAWETLKRGAGRAMEHLPGVGPFLKAAERVTP